MAGLTITAAAASNDRPSSDNTDESITVIGSKSEADKVRERAVEFVRRTGVATGEKTVARWIDPVCPKVIGVDAQYAKIVETKMRAIARDIRASLVAENCQTNIVVAFTPDAGKLVRAIARRGPSRLRHVPVSARGALFEGVAPLRWWYTTELRSRDGMSATSFPPPWAAGAEGGGSPLPMNIDTLSHYNSSLVSTQTVRALVSATVVIDVDRAEGLPLEAVAAYAAFVAYAETQPQPTPPQGSVLSLFEHAEIRSLTDRDMAFLSTLYSLPLDRRARQQRGRLVKSLVSVESERE